MIIDSIINFFSSLLQILPKSVKYLLALALVLGFLAVMPFFSHLLGYHCDSNKQVMTTPFIDFATNLDIATTDVTDVVNYTDYMPFATLDEVYTGLGICVNYVNFSNPTTDYRVKFCKEGSTNCFYVLRASNPLFSNKPKCVVCDDYRLLNFDEDSEVSQNGYYCLSNATRKPDIGIDINGNCDYGNCAILPYFEWNNQTGTSRCKNLSICGSNALVKVKLIDLKLDEADAKKAYVQASGSYKYDSAFRMKCDSDFNPQLSLFGIEIFNAKLWVLMYVVAALFFFLHKIRS